MGTIARKNSDASSRIIDAVRCIYPDAIAVSDRFSEGFDKRDTILQEHFTIMIGNRSAKMIERDWDLNLIPIHLLYEEQTNYQISKWCDSIDEAWADAYFQLSGKLIDRMTV